MKDIWAILAIEPTADMRIIKRAYAKQVKNCHQEDEPERWQELHSAYEKAIEMAKQGGGAGIKPSNVNAVQNKEEKGTKLLETTEVFEQPEIPKTQEEAKHSKGQKQHDERKWTVEFMTEMEQEPSKQTEEIVKKRSEILQEQAYEKSFENIQGSTKKQNEVLLRQVKEQLQEIITLPPKQQKEALTRFLESWSVQQLLTEITFWQETAQILRLKKLNRVVYRFLKNELLKVYEASDYRLSDEVKNEIQIIAAWCEQIASKKENAMRVTISIVIGLGTLLSYILFKEPVLRAINTEYTYQEIEEAYISYLNEKYQMTEYDKRDIKLKKIEKPIIINGNRKDVAVTYEVTIKATGDFLGYAMIVRDAEYRPVEIFCLDNLEMEKIVYAFNEEMGNLVNTGQGEVVIEKSSTDTFYRSFGIEKVVFHTEFEGDILELCQNEKEIKENVFGSYDKENDTLEQSYGCVYYYYADEQIETIYERLNMEKVTYDEKLIQRLIAFEEKSGFQVVASAMPQSYYHAVFVSEESMLYDIPQGKKQNDDFPMSSVFITRSYWNGGMANEDTGEIELWGHCLLPVKEGEGIYLISDRMEKEVEEESLQLQITQKNGKNIISIAAEEGVLEEYLLVLDKEVLRIGTEYEAFSGVDRYRTHDYTLTMELNKWKMIYEGENLLMIPIGAQESDKSFSFAYPIAEE